MKSGLIRLISIWLIAAAAAAQTPDERLLEAARTGDQETVAESLAAGANPNAANEFGATALNFAADAGHFEIAKLLVEKGADVNARDRYYGASPIGRAAQKGHADIVGYLLSVSAQDKAGAIRSAVSRDQAETLRVILQKGQLSNVQLSAARRDAERLGKTRCLKVFDEAGITSAPPAELDSETLERYAGEFRNWRGEVFTLSVESANLRLIRPDMEPLALAPVSKTEFKPAESDGVLRLAILFDTEDESMIQGFQLTEGGDPLVFMKTDRIAPVPLETLDSKKEARKNNWGQFRGESASGVAEGANPPIAWNAGTEQNIAWKITIPGLAHSSPILWGDKIFLTTAVSADPDANYFRHGLYGDVDTVQDDSGHQWKVLALDKESGAVAWEALAHEGVPKIKRHMKSTHANSTPATDGERIVAFFGSEGLYCYAMDGHLIWKKDLGVLDSGWFYDPSYQWGFASSPVIHNGRVIIQCDIQKDSFIAALDVATGEEIWRTRRDEIPSWGSPLVWDAGGRIQIVTNATNAIRGYEFDSGREIWKLTPNSTVTAPTPIAAYGLVFVTSGYRPIQPIYAIRPEAAGDISLKEGETSNEFIEWSTMRNGPYMPTPIVVGDYLYTCSNNGILTCYDARSGEQKYRARLGHMGGGYSASPVATADRIYFPSEDGEVFVVAAEPEYHLLARNPTGDLIMATPAISGETIFVRTVRELVAISR